MNDSEKMAIIQELEMKLGPEISDNPHVDDIEADLVQKKEHLHLCLHDAKNEVTYKLSSALVNAEKNSKQIEDFKARSEELKKKIADFLDKTAPFREVINKKVEDVNKLQSVMDYLKSFEKIDEMCSQLKQCTDDEQAVLLYGDLKELSKNYTKGHRAGYIKENTHYWHNVLKDRLTKQYEDLLKALKWPFTTAQDNPQPSKDVLRKFSRVTTFLLLIEDTTAPPVNTTVSGDYTQELNPCLPVRILLRPLKKRFAFHFAGSRQTARIDRPEWFLTQTLTWIKDHQGFIRMHVQPVADGLNMKHVRAENEFNAGLVALASERLHTVLGLYQSQGLKGEMLDVEAAFAHAVDETLGFHKELLTVTGQEANSVLSVLTRAETFVKWLAVEKKYALAKMDETLSTDEWMDVISMGGASKEPRGADWFIAMLAAIEQRYTPLPRPGHRLQFLELQLELIEEWRIRLTQIQNAAVSSLNKDSFLKADDSPHPLTAVINAANHTRSILLQWAHTLHYLQLHYYRRQFRHFTLSQRRDENLTENSEDISQEKSTDENLSLQDMETQAERMALSEISRRNSSIALDYSPEPEVSSTVNLLSDHPGDTDLEDAGVFAEAPALLAHLRDAGLAAFGQHILIEFKAGLVEYKKLKWHAMPIVEEMAQTISSCLCLPLSGLCARLHSAKAKLATSMYVKMRNHIAGEVDTYIFEKLVLVSWWNTGGTMQFNHDVKRNLMPTFAPSSKVATSANMLPRLNEALKVLNMDYEDARSLRSAINKSLPSVSETLSNLNIRHISPQHVYNLLTQRTDLTDSLPPSVMELF